MEIKKEILDFIEKHKIQDENYIGENYPWTMNGDDVLDLIQLCLETGNSVNGD